MADGSGVEEQFVLRVLDEALADKLHRILREEITTQGHIELTFSDNNQDGVLTVEGIPYPVKLLNLPTVVEAYKTYDDINMVKINDVGQLLLVGPPGSSLPEGPESADGITPPLRNARKRHFKPLPKHPSSAGEYPHLPAHPPGGSGGGDGGGAGPPGAAERICPRGDDYHRHGRGVRGRRGDGGRVVEADQGQGEVVAWMREGRSERGKQRIRSWQRTVGGCKGGKEAALGRRREQGHAMQRGFGPCACNGCVFSDTKCGAGTRWRGSCHAAGMSRRKVESAARAQRHPGLWVAS
ncbi:hypothetical protein Vretimale_19535 [Volvox reticuliferus]|uniref:TAFII55 protein conserved region domain-containing protein n=1 Tax=Volvox reticuliferus TaxID=1737510 RepID=A0A8J4H094_9CHLO|nr:hypothetical protein Vretimale_19535 [Volvox reticuliferus]